MSKPPVAARDRLAAPARRRRSRFSRPFLLAAAALGIAGAAFTGTAGDVPSVPFPALAPAARAAVVQDTVRITIAYGSTAVGQVDIRLFGDVAPLTVANFLKYVEVAGTDSPNYLGTVFHRSVPGFVVQGGGYTLGSDGLEDIGDYGNVVNEFNLPNIRGTVSMAKLGEYTDADGNTVPADPDSASSEWFVSIGDNRENLDAQNGGFTVFGEVTTAAGLDLFDAINALTDADGIPLVDVDGDGVGDYVLYIAAIELLSRDNSVNDRVHQWALGGSGVWSYEADAFQIVNGNGVTRPFTPNNEALFSTPSGSAFTITVAGPDGGPIAVSDLTVTGDGDTLFTGGAIEGRVNPNIPSSTGSLYKTGAGTAVFSATALDFEGGIQVGEGTLSLLDGASVSASTPLTVAAGATLLVNGATLESGATLAAGATLDVGPNGLTAPAGSVNLTGATLAGSPVITAAANPYVLSATTLAGGATLTVDGAALAGGLTLAAGSTILLQNGGSVGAGATLVFNGGALAGTGTVAAGASVTLNSAVIAAGADITFAAAPVIPAGGSLHLAGDPAAPAATRLAAPALGNAGTLTGSGVLDLAGGALVNRGIIAPGDGASGKLVFTGALDNSAGELRFAVAADGSRNVLVNAGAADVVLTGAIDITVAAEHLAANALTLDLNPFLESTGAGSLAFASDGSATFAYHSRGYALENADYAAGTATFRRINIEIPGLRRELTPQFLRALNAAALDDDGALDRLLHNNPAAAAEAARLSPLGFSSMTALPVTLANDAATDTRRHLAERRAARDARARAVADRIARAKHGEEIADDDPTYDPAPAAAAYLSATGGVAKNGNGAGKPAFDTQNAAVAAGVDQQFGKQFTLGATLAAAGGRADIHNNGGRIEHSQFALAGYAEWRPFARFWLDGGLRAAVNRYDTTRRVGDGSATTGGGFAGTGEAKNTANAYGYDFSAHFTANASLPLGDTLALVPHAGIVADYAEVEHFRERTGTTAYMPLEVDFFSQYSLRAVAGAALEWTPSEFLRLTLRAAYGRELIDTIAPVKSTFRDYAAAGKFKVNAPAVSENYLEAGPAIEFVFDPSASLRLDYTYQTDLGRQNAHRLNAALTFRF
ncbi:MAG: autotransporter domain-containing protein [Puniceicoccales bacterium]|jgi:cyclophilin family peptidyl-prolyl cis-trans isomerase|nr:autotransporter domain-containing protein [Puniceicoccales bacterium]